MSSKKSRFAPSPTGLMHIGNARTALFSALLGDVFLLRIEDTDAERSREEFVSGLIEDLHWLGLDWQEGPSNAEPEEAWFQSKRTPIYDRYYQQLIDSGLAYPCFCTPTELEIARKVQLSSGRPPRYSGKCARLSPEDIERKRADGLEPTLRFKVPQDAPIRFTDGVRGPQQFEPQDIGDFIIRRADGSSAFFFCNAIDDALMGVTHVLRGEDHLTNTPRQLLILEALGLPQPAYAHGSLILGEDGAPLSKRNGSRSIAELRHQGYFPKALVNMMARLGHYYDSDELMSLAELKSGFGLEHLGKSPARFDFAHLEHWQTLAVRTATDLELEGWIPKEIWQFVPPERHDGFREVVRSNCLYPKDALVWAEILFTDQLTLDEAAMQAVQSAGESFFLSALDLHAQSAGDYSVFLEGLKTATGAKGKGLFMPLRSAWTGRHDGPDLATLYRLIDADRLHRRMAEFTYASQ
jgi:glutamyl-tRNA synthetase